MTVWTNIAYHNKNVISVKTTTKITSVAKNVQAITFSLVFLFMAEQKMAKYTQKYCGTKSTADRTKCRLTDGDLHKYMDMMWFSSHECLRKEHCFVWIRLWLKCTSEKMSKLFTGRFLHHALMYLKKSAPAFKTLWQ